jgi:hypothetical protein
MADNVDPDSYTLPDGHTQAPAWRARLLKNMAALGIKPDPSPIKSAAYDKPTRQKIPSLVSAFF